MSEDNEEGRVLRVSEIGPEPSKSRWHELGTELHRMMLEGHDVFTRDGQIIDLKTRADIEPVVLGVDVARDGGDTTIIIGRRREHVVFVDEMRSIPPELVAALSKRFQDRADDIARELILGPIGSKMGDTLPILITGRGETFDWSEPQNPMSFTPRPPPISMLAGMTTQAPPEKPTRYPTTPADLERLHLAEVKRARKAAKRRRDMGEPEPCQRCDDNGFVEVYSHNPPAFADCPVCFNPKGHPHP
jgi:hypothetical protein